MAKANICTSLCVCEVGEQPNTQRWRRIADMNRMGGSAFFYATPKGVKPAFIPAKPSMSAAFCDVRVMDWQVSGLEVESTVNPRVAIYELAELEAFQSLHMEDEEEIRKTLEHGFLIPNTMAKPFSRGTTALIIAIPSKSGRKQGLLFADKSKLIFDDPNMALGFSCTTRIASTPSDAKRATHTIPIVDIEDVGVIDYLAPTGKGKRAFLALTPETIGEMQLYSADKYIPIFMKRQLERSKTTIQLSDGRALTGKDINIIMDAVKEALKDDEQFSDLMQIKDRSTIKKIADDVAAYLPILEKEMVQDSALLDQIRDLIWARDSIREACLEHSKTVWQETHKEELLEAEKDLEEMKRASARKEHLLKECKAIDDHLADAVERNEQAKQAFRKSVQDYKNDLASLATAYGIESTPLPLITASSPIQPIVQMPVPIVNSLMCNLNIFLSSENALAAANFIVMALDRAMHIAAEGSVAELIAYALSATLEGVSPAKVTRADMDCSVSDLMRAIETQSSRVVLVEGVMGCAEDIATLTISRQIRDKIIVFSLDDPYNREKMSRMIFSRVAVLHNIEQEKTPTTFGWEQACDVKISMKETLGYTSFNEAEDPAQALCVFQNHLVTGKETL